MNLGREECEKRRQGVYLARLKLLGVAFLTLLWGRWARKDVKGTCNRSTITGVNDLWCPYISPEVMVKLTRRERGHFVKLIASNTQAIYHCSRNGYVKLAFIIHLWEDVLSCSYLLDCNEELTHNNQQKPQTIEYLKIISNVREGQVLGHPIDKKLGQNSFSAVLQWESFLTLWGTLLHSFNEKMGKLRSQFC